MAEATGGGDDLSAWEMALSPLCNWTSVTEPDCNQAHLPVTQLEKHRFEKPLPRKKIFKETKFKTQRDLRLMSKVLLQKDLSWMKGELNHEKDLSSTRKGRKLLENYFLEYNYDPHDLGCNYDPPDLNELLQRDLNMLKARELLLEEYLSSTWKGRRLLRINKAIDRCNYAPPNVNDLLKFNSLQLDEDQDCGLHPHQECGLNVDPEGEGRFDPDSEPDWADGFDPDLDPDWNSHNVVSWDEHVVEALHLVRLYQITEDDPLHGLPVITRFCKFNIALFDFEKESKAIRGPPILELSACDDIKLPDSINIVSFKILKSDVEYPVSVFGTVLVRDQFDYKCIYVFKRGRDNAQVINSPKDMLTLTDPCRALAVTNGMFFEINLKIKCGDSGDMDFSKGVIERDIFICDKELKTRQLDSWHSSVQLVYTPVPCAVAANLAVNVLDWPCDLFIGEVTAWTSGNENQIILYNSEVEGTETSIGDDGSVVLSRCLVAVPVNEELMLRVCVREGDSEAACFELSLGHLDDIIICSQGAYTLHVKVEWTAILNETEKGVLRHVGDTLLVV